MPGWVRSNEAPPPNQTPALLRWASDIGRNSFHLAWLDRGGVIELRQKVVTRPDRNDSLFANTFPAGWMPPTAMTNKG
jgi:hypothetical protein